jgi:hypothetical protein
VQVSIPLSKVTTEGAHRLECGAPLLSKRHKGAAPNEGMDVVVSSGPFGSSQHCCEPTAALGQAQHLVNAENQVEAVQGDAEAQQRSVLGTVKVSFEFIVEKLWGADGNEQPQQAGPSDGSASLHDKGMCRSLSGMYRSIVASGT